VPKVFVAVIIAVVAMLTAVPALADGSGDPTAVKDENGKYLDKDGTPTYKISSDGTVDWYTYSGFRRYHSDCHVCHGPDGEGSSYAPALANSLKTMLQRFPGYRRKRAAERQHSV
jgi:mono/diheme cytochrome c family protein